MPGLTAWQGLFEHGASRGADSLVHGAAGVVGSMASQLAVRPARMSSAPGAAGGRQTASTRAQEFSTSITTPWKMSAEVDLVFDVIGGDIAKRSAA